MGEYVSMPYSKYHWTRDWDQDFIRINNNRSKALFELDSTTGKQRQDIILDTLALKLKIPKAGIITNLDESNKRKLNEFILKNLKYYQIPGASLAIFNKNGIIFSENYGFKNPISREPVTARTLFEVGSITKPVFTFTVLRLAEKQKIDLDKPLYHYLPFKDVAHDDRYKLITARHVLSHQTGFPNWAHRNEKGQFDLLFEPGTKFGYSGEAFEYLKRVVVHITGKDIETNLENELINPLDLQNFYFKTTDYVQKNAADAIYRGIPSKIRFIEEPGMAYSLVTTSSDFIDFALTIANRKGLTDEMYTEMFKNHISVNENVYRGLGLEIGSDSTGEFYGHSGITRDFVSVYKYYPDLERGYVFLTNNITGLWLTLIHLNKFLVTGDTNKMI
ncbi:serine hydrolase [Gramella sp. KN1008]|uniref:serine hydrolase domain-containing protein n=1 Tax=Gramella sp. KN1008 TaxID=2529298 RepID=UPI00103B6C01|nr:serine hydrolase domain-containing protein [Gramella sp. KN1008]TBW25908.1 class A beta-lactamase-related serine hydrolase [Gramella sp. KN1008]